MLLFVKADDHTLLNKRHIIWSVLWVGLNIADYIITYIIFTKYDGIELNPILSPLSLPYFIGAKVVLPLGVILLLYKLKKLYLLEPLTIGVLVVVVYMTRWLFL